MNRSTLPLNAERAEEETLSIMLIQSIQQSLKARMPFMSSSLSQSTESRFVLHGCIVVEDETNYYSTTTPCFSYKISCEEQTQLLNTVRNKSLAAFQKTNATNAALFYQLAKSVSEVFADDRHFRHLNRLYAAIYVNADSLRLCTFTTGCTWSKRVLLLNFEEKKVIREAKNEAEEKEINAVEVNKKTLFGRFFKR